MNWPLAFVIAVVFALAVYSGTIRDRQKAEIAVACVSSGGEWKKPSWGEPQGCVR